MVQKPQPSLTIYRGVSTPEVASFVKGSSTSASERHRKAAKKERKRRRNNAETITTREKVNIRLYLPRTMLLAHPDDRVARFETPTRRDLQSRSHGEGDSRAETNRMVSSHLLAVAKHWK